jgi:hypothetical protein
MVESRQSRFVMSPKYKAKSSASPVSASDLTGLAIPRVESCSGYREYLADLRSCGDQEQLQRILVARRLSKCPDSLDGRDSLVPYIAQASAETRREIVKRSIATKSTDRHAMIRAALLSCWSAREVKECVAQIPKSVQVHASLQAAVSFGQFVIVSELFEPLLETRRSRELRHETFCASLAQFLVQGGAILKSAKALVGSHYVRPLAEFLGAGLTAFTQVHDQKRPLREKVGVMQSFLNTVETFQKYGVIFLNGTGRRSGCAMEWNAHEVAELSEVLDRVPGWVLWGTPLLCAIVRRGESPYGFHASRLNNGDIELNEGAFAKTERAPYLPGWSTAQIALCHEVGHALHFAHRYELKLAEDGTITQSGNRAIDFPRYAGISEWRVIHRRPQLIRDNQYALLRGFEVPLDCSLDAGNGGRVQFSHDPYAPSGSPLWVHNPDAGFPLGLNAHTSPWEDFADSFAMYILAETELRALAPTKWRYFDELVWKPAPSEIVTGPHSRGEICTPKALRRILS